MRKSQALLTEENSIMARKNKEHFAASLRPGRGLGEAWERPGRGLGSGCLGARGVAPVEPTMPPKTANASPQWPIFFVSTDPRSCVDIRAAHRVPADENPQDGAD